MIFDVEINSAAHYPAPGVVDLIVLAEQVGFGAFWKGESNSTDPLVLLSGVASRTKTIKLGTAIYHIYGRSPVTLGIQSATLQDLSGGRLLLGLGVANKAIAGWHGGVFDRPLKRAREYIDVVRKVAAGERVEYEGEIYQTGQRFQLSWKPSYPKVPIYLAGLGPQMKTQQTPLTGAHAARSCNDCHVGGNFQGLSSDCAACHLGEYQATTNPNHAAMGFPTSCEQCHNTTRWQGATFNHRFPISGPHQLSCADCHLQPGNLQSFSCTHCHDHDQPTMNDKHREVQNYSWSSPACLQCHPQGRH